MYLSYIFFDFKNPLVIEAQWSIDWKRQWHPTAVLLPGESQGWGMPGGLPSLGSHRVGHD